jgi:hypothetical protein
MSTTVAATMALCVRDGREGDKKQGRGDRDHLHKAILLRLYSSLHKDSAVRTLGKICGAAAHLTVAIGWLIAQQGFGLQS